MSAVVNVLTVLKRREGFLRERYVKCVLLKFTFILCAMAFTLPLDYYLVICYGFDYLLCSLELKTSEL